MTTIQDVLTYADGSKANGRLAVFWRPFTIGNANVTGGELAYDIVDGAVSVTVYPNAGALPSGSYYSAKYELENGVVYVEQWIVPNLPTVNLGQVRVSFPPTPSILISPTQLTSMNAQPGMFLMWDGVRWVPGYPSTFNLNPNWIGINIGGLGTDVNVVGSPVSVGNYATIHVPDASPAARGVVTTAAQTIGGPKTFANTATISQSLLFTQHTVYTAIRGELVNIGSGAAHALNFGGDIVALRIAGTDRTRMQADRLVGGHLDLDTIADPPTATMPGSALSPLKGAETISLPHDGIDWAGIGMAVDGSLWLRTAGVFLYLNANGVTCRELRMDPYQHPNAAGVEAVRSDATMVVYSDSTSWGGYGVDNTPQLWFRMGPNSGAAYYYFGSGGATFPGLTVTHLTVSGSITVPAGSGLIPTYWVDGSLVGTRPILNLLSGDNVGLTGIDTGTGNRVDITINSSGTGGAIVDPTDTKGDLIVRGAAPPAAVTKLGVGTNGQVLTADNTVVTGIKWAVATIANDSSTQRLRISYNGALKGTRQELNLIPGANVTLTVVDNPGNNSVDATVAVGSGSSIQTPWLSDINAAGFKLYSTGAIGVANDLTVLPNTGVNAHLVVGGPTTFGRITAAFSTASVGVNVGGFSFANYAITVAEKRICQIVGATDVGIDSGALVFYTFAAGVIGERMRITSTGRMGVGTVSPLNLFTVHTGTDQNLGIRYDTGAAMIGFGSFNDAGTLAGPLMYNATKHYFQGAVGVGTSGPQYQLHVAAPSSAPQFAIGVDSNPLYNLQFSYSTVGAVIQVWNNGNGSPLALNPAGGNVGIGTASPAAPLSLGYQSNDPNLRSYANMEQGCLAFYVAQNFPATNNYQRVLDIVAGGGNVGGNIRFMTQQAGAAAATAMFISPAGNIGIGTNAPSRLLQVQSASGVVCSMNFTQSGWASWDLGTPASSGDFVITQVGTAERVRITSAGNVGIGAVPQFRFDVNGGRATFSPASEQYAVGFRYVNTGPVFWQGADLNGDMIFSEAGGSERMRIKATGNVGIGTNAPVSKLGIIPSVNPTTPDTSALLSLGETSNNSVYGLRLGYFYDSGGGTYRSVIQGWTAASSGTLLLNPSGGNVGIGVGSPGAALHIMRNAPGGMGPILLLQNAAGGAEDQEAITFMSGGADRAQIRSTAHGADGYAGTVEFWTGVTTLTEKMRLSGNGNLGIGTNAPGYPLHVVGYVNATSGFLVNGVAMTTGIAGMMVQNNGGAASGPYTYFNLGNSAQMSWSIAAGGPGNNTLTITAIYSTSDARLKQNITPLEGGLSIIGQLRPVRAEWNGLGSRTAGQPTLSVIAQDLQTVIPDAVFPFPSRLRPEDEEPTEFLSIDPMGIVSHLILAVQQLERRLKFLEGR